MEEQVRFGLSANSSLIWGGGRRKVHCEVNCFKWKSRNKNDWTSEIARLSLTLIAVGVTLYSKRNSLIIHFFLRHSDGALVPSTPQLINHRWEIPAKETVTLRIRFRSEELGQFDQTLNFEIMGTRRRYQLFCRGVCAFPAISREPRVVFPHRRKYRKAEEIVHKKYVLSNETFEFGPLLCGKIAYRPISFYGWLSEIA